MGVTEKRAKHKEAFRREILDAAREIFINDGYDGFSMRRLAEKIDYSPTTIYLYFRNKDDLLFAICEEFFSKFFAELKRMRSVSKDPLETLRKALYYLVEFGLRNPNQYKMIFFSKGNVYGTHEEFVEKDSMARNTALAFREMIRDCIRAGQLRESDEEVIAPALASASHGLVAMVLCHPDMPARKGKAIARVLVESLLRGLQK